MTKAVEVPFFATTCGLVFSECFTEHRKIAHQGGTWSGKTYSILQALCKMAYDKKRDILVTGESYPNLKSGPIKQLNDIINNSPYLSASKYITETRQANNHTFKFQNGSLITFRAYETEQDAKSGKRDILFVNEANGVQYEIVDQLITRTTEKVIFDYNSDCRFWVHDMIDKGEVFRFRSWYIHNPYCPESIIKEIESKKFDDNGNLTNWYKVYGQGKTGEIKGAVITRTSITRNFPENIPQDHKRYGMDFGFSAHPTCLVECFDYDGHLYTKHLFYENGLVAVGEDAVTTDTIEHRIMATDIRNCTIMCDSATPTMITELNNSSRLRGRRIRFVGASKPPDSIQAGINWLNSRKIYIHSSSFGAINEIANYKINPNTGKPFDKFNHFFDALRYANNELIMSARTRKTKSYA